MRKQVVTASAVVLVMAATGAPARAATPRLTKQQAALDAGQAVRQALLAKMRKPVCKMSSTSRAVCTGKWTYGLRTFIGTVTVTRAGTAVSPVDSYVIKATGTARYLSKQRISRSGRLIVPTRAARVGQTLRLLGYDFDGTDVQITPGQPTDPFTSSNEFETPDDGTRFVAYPVTVQDVGKSRFTDGLYGFKLILSDNTELDGTSAEGFDSEIDMGPGETRQACVVFDVPTGSSVKQLQYDAGQETGVWKP